MPPLDPAAAAERFARALEDRHGMGVRVVVGVSGGVDSTVLLRTLHDAGLDVVAAHVNYHLRGDESDGDERFVRDVAAELDVPCVVHHVRKGWKGNTQQVAREVRYGFFPRVAHDVGAPVVAVGSTFDDQAETVLLALLRGTGLHGLVGMQPERRLGEGVVLARPFLETSRATIEAHARAHGWTWREDSSNLEDTYRRNALRHKVMPALKEHFGDGVPARIVQTAGRLRGHLDVMLMEGALIELVRVPGETALRVDALRHLPLLYQAAVYHAALETWMPEVARSTLPAIVRLLDAPVGQRVEWPGAVVWRDRDALAFRRAEAGEPLAWELPIPRASGTYRSLEGGTLTMTPLDAVPATFDATRNGVVVDADAVTPPLVLRTWRAGDRFRPLGLDGTKLVSDLLTERRVPPQDRARQFVLTAGGEIVWVVGHRLAHEARVTPATTRAVQLRWKPAERS